MTITCTYLRKERASVAEVMPLEAELQQRRNIRDRLQHCIEEAGTPVDIVLNTKNDTIKKITKMQCGDSEFERAGEDALFLEQA